MEKYVRKHAVIEARENDVRQVVVSHRKGDQTANKGDFLVVDDDAVVAIQVREKNEGVEPGTYGLKGTIYVVPREEFLADYELQQAVEESPEVPVPTE